MATIESLEPDLKKILYRCLEDVRATKAAIYLSEEGKPYELVASYGFQDTLRRQIKGNDPIVERLILRKAAFFINGRTSEQRYYETLFHTDSERMLIAPLFAGGQLIGFVDMRDKAGNQAFTPADIQQAAKIVQEFFALFAREQLFGQDAAATTDSSTAMDGGVGAISAVRVVEYAEQIVTRELAAAGSRQKILTEAEVAPIETTLAAILSIPGVVLAAFSAFGHLGNIQPVAVRSSITDVAMRKFDDKLRGWMSKQGMAIVAEETRTRLIYPFGTTGGTIQPGQLASILSAPVNVGSIHGLVLSVGFEASPDRDTQMHLANFLKVVELTLQHSISHYSVRMLRQKAADRLSEPDFEKYPELVDHSRRVSDLAEQFAHNLALPPHETETIRIAALVHDVGMRLLDYANLHRKKSLTEQEFGLVKKHPVVGAALIAESPLGDEVAMMVLHHHERVDGRGYPYGLRGEQIPVGAKILHICEAFDAMTAIQSYQPRMPESTALLQIARGAGAQFDADLAQRFVAMLGGV